MLNQFKSLLFLIAILIVTFWGVKHMLVAKRVDLFFNTSVGQSEGFYSPASVVVQD